MRLEGSLAKSSYNKGIHWQALLPSFPKWLMYFYCESMEQEINAQEHGYSLSKWTPWTLGFKVFFPFCESPTPFWIMVKFPEKKEQCCHCGGYGLSLQLVWAAAAGCNSLVCDSLGELCDVSGMPFTCNEVWHRGWWNNSWSQHSAVPGWEGWPLLRTSGYKCMMLMHQICPAPFMAGSGFYLPWVYLVASYCLVSPFLLSFINALYFWPAHL